MRGLSIVWAALFSSFSFGFSLFFFAKRQEDTKITFRFGLSARYSSFSFCFCFSLFLGRKEDRSAEIRREP